MYPGAFEYHRADSVAQALSLLGRFGEQAKLLAGGQSLLPMMKLRLAEPRHLIDIGGIAGLDAINEQGGRIRIGALARHDAVASSDLLRRRLPLLAECAAEIGDLQVRNMGTLGGSLVHADPGADYPAAVLALEGEIVVEGPGGRRTLKAEQFFLDLMTTALKPAEMLVEVNFAPLSARTGGAYVKHRQPASGFALVGVAAVVGLNQGGAVERCRVGVTGLAAAPFRALAVEQALTGKTPDARSLADAASHAADGKDALSDIHASADFRAELARVHTQRALEKAVERAR
jgi:carbon-monoxide dehydrogenase medium subunit